MIEDIKQKIFEKLQKSLLDEDAKKFLLTQIDDLNDDQAIHLLSLLKEEETMGLQIANEENSKILDALIKEMKNLSETSLKKARIQIENTEAAKEEKILTQLEQNLKSL